MPNVEEMIRRWAAAWLDVPVEEVTSVEFRHDESYGNDDTGTWWPAQTYAIAKLVSTAEGFPKRPRTREIPTYAYEDIHALLKEILAA